MLPARHRLPKQDISKVMRFGLRVTSDELLLRYKKTNQPPRFAIIVSTKIDKRATVRNRIRRIISESIRHKVPPIDGVFIVRKNIGSLSQKEVQVLLEKTFHEIIHS